MLEGVALSKYLGIFGTLIAAGFGFPIPEEIPIVTAGAFVGHDAQPGEAIRMHGAVGGGSAALIAEDTIVLTKWYIMLPVCILGVVLSDCILYFVGRWFGPKLLRSGWVQRKLLPPDKRASIEENFEKRGVMILLGARLTPGIRTPVFIMAGMLRMPVSRFLLADALYAIPGVNLLFWLSYWFTDQFVETIHAVDKHRPLVVVAVLAAVAGIVIYKFVSNRKLSTGNPEDIPQFIKPVGVMTHAIEQTIEKTVGKAASQAGKFVDVVSHPFGHTDKPNQSEIKSRAELEAAQKLQQDEKLD